MYKNLIGAAVVLALSVSAAAFADPAKVAEEKCHEVAKEEAVPAEDMKIFMEDCMAEVTLSEKEAKELDKQPKSE